MRTRVDRAAHSRANTTTQTTRALSLAPAECWARARRASWLGRTETSNEEKVHDVKRLLEPEGDGGVSAVAAPRRMLGLSQGHGEFMGKAFTQQRARTAEELALVHRVKRVRFGGHTRDVLLQNLNGPCPLLALGNALLLRGDVSVPPGWSEFPIARLIASVREVIRANSAGKVQATRTAALLPELQRGLDVDVGLGSPCSFSRATDLLAFELCGVRVLHGWVADADAPGGALLRTLSYEELTRRLVSGGPDEDGTEAALRQAGARFLEHESTAQMTPTGLRELHGVVSEGELCVLFRNNHFSTLTKRDGALWTLITDLGYERVAAVAWERLDSLNGDTQLASPDFGDPQTYVAAGADIGTGADLAAAAASSAYDVDLMLAMQMQAVEDRRARGGKPRARQTTKPTKPHDPAQDLKRHVDCCIM